jgi:predicted small lipoprotein YifL
MRRITTLLLSTALLAACGQKGPLFLPEKKGEAVQTTVTPVTPSPDAAPAPPPTNGAGVVNGNGAGNTADPTANGVATPEAAAAERERQKAERRATNP